MSPIGVTGTISSGQLADVGTIGTIISGQVTASISAGALADVGTIGTIISGQVTASISSGQLTDVATIGTILAPLSIGTILSPLGITVTSIATIGTIQWGQVTVQQQIAQTNILGGVTVVTGTAVASTLLARTLQDLEVDSVYGTVVSGSIQSVVFGVEPQSNVKTSTIVSGDWYNGTVQTGQRIIALGPLGAKFVVGLNTGATSTILGVYLTAVQTTTS